MKAGKYIKNSNDIKSELITVNIISKSTWTWTRRSTWKSRST